MPWLQRFSVYVRRPCLPPPSGSIMRVVMNTTRETGGRDLRTNVMIAYLKSYEKMGRADFE